ncbi:MAG: TetR/AcrR family transcriptional regulator [Aquificaceae bacterium]|nr:TetR/AcrR family transcriptional regulator [Aquificaceae bacterium]MDW8433599.1 TetR/AcrR family transcriptional regulator [Aquificaceae bacterium]
MNARERIVQSAKELFSKKGYSNTSVEEIVKHAGLSKGAFYFYFRSKDQLMEELVNRMAERTKEIMRQWLNKNVSSEEAIKGHIRDFLVECYEDRHIVYVFFFELMCSKESFRELHYKNMEDIKRLLYQMVKRGYEQGEFTCGSPEVLVNLIVGYIRLVYIEKLLMEGNSLDGVLREAEEGLNLIFRGIKCGS